MDYEYLYEKMRDERDRLNDDWEGAMAQIADLEDKSASTESDLQNQVDYLRYTLTEIRNLALSLGPLETGRVLRNNMRRILDMANQALEE